MAHVSSRKGGRESDPRTKARGDAFETQAYQLRRAAEDENLRIVLAQCLKLPKSVAEFFFASDKGFLAQTLTNDDLLTRIVTVQT